jgi:hypothetical protein
MNGRSPVDRLNTEHSNGTQEVPHSPNDTSPAVQAHPCTSENNEQHFL